ncbi:MAG: hypothetical protein EBT00_11865 [Proteobacteria bacterium]|nr:hypothetical protein [Pseudomonadota bacterium]NBT93863.1 hypothetical protein [Chloroflexota bacterium]NDE07081.1 hypothetical protein [Chloroflexota bacterium]NDF37927.1 hypothetical protein [Pseudomonadota bacterium]HAN14200.1 hypothetical protein [Chloroflexota bacterium]
MVPAPDGSVGESSARRLWSVALQVVQNSPAHGYRAALLVVHDARAVLASCVLRPYWIGVMMRWTLGLLLWGLNRGMEGRKARGPWGHFALGLDPTQLDVWSLHAPQ